MTNRTQAEAIEQRPKWLDGWTGDGHQITLYAEKCELLAYIRSLEADRAKHLETLRNYVVTGVERDALRKQRDELLDALKKAVSAGVYVVRLVEDTGNCGASPDPGVKSDWLGTAMHCYGAMAFLPSAHVAIANAESVGNPDRHQAKKAESSGPEKAVR